MPLSRVHQVRSYDDSKGLQTAVRAALEADPSIANLLATQSASRLVVVKPNWVQESHEYNPAVWEPVITHPRVLLTVIEQLAAVLGGRGTLAVCDAPHTYASFDAIVSRGGFREHLDGIRKRFPALSLELIDLRREVWVRREEVTVERRTNSEDPRGYVQLDLGRDSLFFRGRGKHRYYGADYDLRIVNEHHCGDVQEYLLAGTPMASDLFVNVPKLKTHKKTGITCSLKNLVGINGDKNWLPHHTEGSPRSGGDEFPEERFVQWLERSVKHAGRRLMLRLPGLGNWVYRKLRNTGKTLLGDSDTTIRNGNWHGNDTCWRMALDLNRALLYGRSDGTWRDVPKPYLSIVDGIVGGEGNGPLCPDAVNSGVLVSGNDAALVDATAARLMGFDPHELSIVREATRSHRWPITTQSLDAMRVFDGRLGGEIALHDVLPAVPGGFRPHFGWMKLNTAAIDPGCEAPSIMSGWRASA